MRAASVLLTAALAAGWAAESAAQSAAAKLPKTAACLVDRKPVSVSPQTPSVHINGNARFFCGAACRTRFAGWPEKYVNEEVKCTVQPQFKGFIQTGRRVEVNNNLYFLCCDPCVGYLRQAPWDYLKELQDPVTGRWFTPSEKSPRANHGVQVYLFESAESKAEYDRDPAKYVLSFRR